MSCTWSWSYCDPLQSSHPAPSGHCHQPPEGGPHPCPIPGRWHGTCPACSAPGSLAQTPGDTVPHHPVDCAGTTPCDRQVESSWWQCVIIISLISLSNVPWSWVSRWHWWFPALPAFPDLPPATYPRWHLVQWRWAHGDPDRSPQGTGPHAQEYNLVRFALKFVCLRQDERKKRNKEWNISLYIVYIGHPARQWLNKIFQCCLGNWTINSAGEYR